MDLTLSLSEICLRDGEYCGNRSKTVRMSETSCCGGLKCVMDAPHPAYCSECKICHDCGDVTFKCLDCKDEPNVLCGGPNNIKCCPAFGCVREDENDKISFGKCLPYP